MIGDNKIKGVVVGGDNQIIGGQTLELISEQLPEQLLAGVVVNVFAVHVFDVENRLIISECLIQAIKNFGAGWKGRMVGKQQ